MEDTEDPPPVEEMMTPGAQSSCTIPIDYLYCTGTIRPTFLCVQRSTEPLAKSYGWRRTLPTRTACIRTLTRIGVRSRSNLGIDNLTMPASGTKTPLIRSNHSNVSTSDVYGSMAEQDEAQLTSLMGSADSKSGGNSITASIGSSIASLGRSVRDEIHHGLHFGGENVSLRQMGGTSTIANSSINLIKNLVGAGVFALPSGVASFADSPSAIVPATFWILAMGAMFAYEFELIGKVCSITLSHTFREVWQDTIGDRGALAVSLVNMLKPALGNLAYSMILADTFRSLFGSMGFDFSRNASLGLITLVGILPLCLLKKLDALAPFSVVGTAGVFLTAICMGIRYFDGSYDPLRSGKFVDDIPADMLPLFGSYNGAWTGSVLVFAAMIYEAFVAHYNSPRFYSELKDASVGRFRVVVGIAFGFSSLVYVIMTSFGYLTFGGNCSGYILNNYSVNDRLATICRVAIAFSILFTYPITFMGFRDGILDIVELPIEQQTSANINIITLVLLAIVTVLASVVTDLGYVNAVGGGTLAAAIVFVFPYLMYSAAMKAQPAPPSQAQRMEVSFAFVLLIIGLIMGLVGVIVELQNE